MKSRYIIGIDLGTTNSAVGYIDLHDTTPGEMDIISFSIPQLTGQGRMGERPYLPSFIYLPGNYDLQDGATALPWDRERNYATGLFARDQGGKVPGRLVSSAKSWLCHGGVDRNAPILPWGAGNEIKKISPVEASARYLLHMREAWNHVMPAPMEEQEIILTVPASFDEVARELTLKAAEKAGLEKLTLLEEPLAAFYSWLSVHENDWNDFISAGERLLICDIGGGTTDFTIVGCVDGDESPRLERLAVGDHLLLGGDNVDLAITALAEKKLKKKLDHSSWQMLYHQCRQAKEAMLSKDGPKTFTVRVAGRGSSLIGSSIATSLDANEVGKMILDGFYPEISIDQALEEEKNPAIREMGLPYEKDAAVTRHLARFIMRQGEGIMPSALLLNGGSLKPALLRNRIRDELSSWAGKEVRLLESVSLDLAISRGAVYYGLARQGAGLRVGGGIARSYYAGVTAGENRARRAICLIERGTGEGEDIELDRQFRVITNRPVRFSLYCSSMRRDDRAGEVVEVSSEDFVSLPPLQTVLKYGKKGEHREIPVKIGARITSIGTLELFCGAIDTPHRWRLQFQLRRQERPAGKIRDSVEGVRLGKHRDAGLETGLTDEDRAGLEQAGKMIRACFTPGPEEEAIPPADLPAMLPEAMGMEKELWSLPVLRAMADILLDTRRGRKRSAMHEARWFNLTGFCMRPGGGEASDPWRMKIIWSLYFEGLAHKRQPDPRLQWWIFWRRVSAGLSTGHQTQMFSGMSHAILPVTSKRGKKQAKKAKKYSPEETRQMWLYMAGLERLDIEKKIEAGRKLLTLLRKKGFTKDALWCLGRLGAREPLYGPADRVIPPGEAASWAETVLKKTTADRGRLADAVVSMARITGDRTRDITTEKREGLIMALQLAGVDEKRIEPLRKYVEPGAREKSAAFGENLPEGLVLDQDDRT